MWGVDPPQRINPKPVEEKGQKFDSGKPRYDLLPPYALDATADVLGYGAEKYQADNWKKPGLSNARYFAAAMRHCWAWKRGEKLDPESGKHHLAHALCCLMFVFEREHEGVSDA